MNRKMAWNDWPFRQSQSLMMRITAFLLLIAGMTGIAHGARFQFGPGASTLRIEVPTAGVLAFAGTDHNIEATRFKGHLEWGKGGYSEARIEVSVPVHSLLVRDENLSVEDREAVRINMLAPEVLAGEAFSAVKFWSTDIRKAGPKEWQVEGKVMIRGFVVPVSFTAEVTQPNPKTFVAAGVVELSLRDFGIEPVSGMGGMVRTAESVRVVFEFFGTDDGA